MQLYSWNYPCDK